MQVGEGFIPDAGLADRKGGSSCVTLVTPALLSVCKPGVFWPQQTWDLQKGRATPGLSLGSGDSMCMGRVWFWKLEVSLSGAPALC